MCDFCGCRRERAIAELSEEHEQLLELGYVIRRLLDEGKHARARRAVGDELAPLLRSHAEKEEQGLFTQLRSRWEADPRLDDLVGEHRELDALLGASLGSDPGWEDAVRKLIGLLSEHMLSEETDLFPYALYELTAVEWHAIDEVHDSHALPRATQPA